MNLLIIGVSIYAGLELLTFLAVVLNSKVRKLFISKLQSFDFLMERRKPVKNTEEDLC